MDISYSARTRSAVSSARGSRVFRSRWNATRMRRQLDAPNGLFVSQLRYILARHHQGDGAMAARTSMLHIRVDDDLKAEATEKLANRSEEHTSELQSLMRISYAVFCLKKKTTTLKK